MIRFALGFFVGVSCAGWVAAHPEAAHMIAAGEHLVSGLAVRLARRMAFI
jgi:hypothetical protein